MKPKTDPRIDAYIAESAEFSRPILKHLRTLVHRACPEAEETLKWGQPSFVRNGAILCFMSAFKAHCGFGFWHQAMKKIVARDGARTAEARGLFGRIVSRADLPDDRTMLRYLRHAVALNESGVPARTRPVAKRRPAPAVPADLAAALRKNRAAAAVFKKLSPSHQREYIEWIAEAKRAETREKRLATTLAWLAEGKSRNWKYANC